MRIGNDLPEDVPDSDECHSSLPLYNGGCPLDSMHTPYLAERVRVRGSEAHYFVVSVDEDKCVVNLIPVSGHGRGLDAVPFSELVTPNSARPNER